MISIPRQRILIELRRNGAKPIIPRAWFADRRYRISRDDGELEKRCSKCHEYLPADDEFFHRDCRRTDDLMNWCKCCCAEYQRDYKQSKHNSSEASPCSP